MERRNRGFTLIEILVVITIIAALAGLVVALVPQLIGRSEEAQSMNNLRNIGGLLLAKQADGTLKRYSGAAFLLQVKDQVADDDLKVFISPADENFADSRPDIGTTEFVAMYRNLTLPSGVEDKHCSYSGPNNKDHGKPKSGRDSLKPWLWACDRCYQGRPYHANGLVALYDTGKVEKIPIDKIEGASKAEGIIQVGANATDERLKKMCYFVP